jgi:hypothetical protein
MNETNPQVPVESAPEIESQSVPQEPAMERLHLRLSAALTRAAPYIVSIDGALVFLLGVYALVNSAISYQGEALLLFVGGMALLLFGFMMVVRWNLPLVRIGLVGVTAGYFASALQEFQVATDPCDIGPRWNVAQATCRAASRGRSIRARSSSPCFYSFSLRSSQC